MRLSLFVLGYKTFTVNPEDRTACANSLLKRGYFADFSRNGELDVPLHKCKRYMTALKKYEFTVSEPKGLPAYFLNNKNRYGIFAGLFLVLLYFIFISGFIFDVRISGNENVPSSVIEKELSDIGFYAGNRWSALSLSEAELKLLETSETIGWVNINRRGNVAYVTVREKTVYEDEENPKGYSNIVASVDSVIEEITVKSGIACVKAGDTVKAGDILISGVIPIELGGGFVRAEGEIYARVSEKISVEVPFVETVSTYGEEKLAEVSIKILKFSINIFKSYRKTHEDCAIIEDVKECVAFGKYRLPIEIRKIYHQPRVKSTKTYDEAKIVSVASVRLAALRQMKLANFELCKMKTYGSFTDEGYKISSDVTYLRDIGEEKYFSDGEK